MPEVAGPLREEAPPGMIVEMQPIFVASILPVSLGLLFAVGAAARGVKAIVPTFVAVAASFIPDLLTVVPGPLSLPVVHVPFRQAIFLFGPFLRHYFFHIQNRSSGLLVHLSVYPVAVVALYLSTPSSWGYIAIQVLRVVHVLAYCIAISLRGRDTRSEPSLRWLQGIVRWFMALFLFMALGGTAALVYEASWIETLVEVVLRLAVTAFLAATWLTVFVSPKVMERRTPPSPPVGDDLLDDIERRFLALMDDGAHRDPQLSLDYCARRIGCPAQYLSYVLNRRLEMSFSDYIAQRRVDDLIDRLRDGALKKWSILGLAFDVGFQSKSSFYSAFRRVTGETPTSFMKKERFGSN